MAIRVEPSVLPLVYAPAAAAAGRAAAAEREAQRTQETVLAQQRMEEAAEQAELNRQLKLLSYKWDIERANAAHAWDLEKMALRSRLDFEKEERRRSQELEEFEIKKKAIMDSDLLSDKEKQLWLLQAETKLPIAQKYIPPAIAPQEAKPIFTPAHVQETLGALATDTRNIIDRPSAIAYAASRLGPDFATKYPEAVNIITKREQAGFAPLTPAGVPPEPTAPPQPSIWQKIKRLWPWAGEEAAPSPTTPPATTPATTPAAAANIPATVGTTPAALVAGLPEPPTYEAFRLSVGKLKAENPELARQYYDKWISKWR